MIPQGLQKDDVQHLQNGDIQETDHIKKKSKNVDKTCNSCESTMSPEWRSSKDRNPVSFENQRNDSSYFQVSKLSNGSVSRNLDSSNNFETVIANDISKDTPLIISRNCDSSRSIESVLPNENSRNREFGINHVSSNFTHDAQSVPQNQSSEGEILIQRDRSMKLCYQELSNQIRAQFVPG